MKTKAEKNRVIALMYHDIVEREGHRASGFPSADAALYKLEPNLFERHLEVIWCLVSDHPALVTDLSADNSALSWNWMLTFDDGGVSSYTAIADKLETFGWRGHFFITTDYVGKPAFMTGAQIRDLHRRGHVIGSHSCSHPLRFASLPANKLKREWSESVRALSDILGEPVRVGSVPGGQYSRLVAQTAAAVGLKVLFTSEPTTACFDVGGCLVLGRYAVRQSTTPVGAAGLASGQFAPRFRQWLWWEFKKAVKTLGGDSYLRLREALMNKFVQSNFKRSGRRAELKDD
ncbi:MAG: polysaccharide deacetylase family protein [Chloracidobacterium sp.]|nr:polysaccharide deacetylase family protein [Chloracidobacterium sp.]